MRSSGTVVKEGADSGRSWKREDEVVGRASFRRRATESTAVESTSERKRK